MLIDIVQLLNTRKLTFITIDLDDSNKGIVG
jgi:hypothetical protein